MQRNIKASEETSSSSNQDKSNRCNCCYLSMDPHPLPRIIRKPLHELFGQIETEFKALYYENQILKNQIKILKEHIGSDGLQATLPTSPGIENTLSGETINTDSVDGKASSKFDISHMGDSNKGTHHSKAPYSHKLKCQTNKLRAQTTWIMSNLKNNSPLNCSPVQRYSGHTDGIWDVGVSKLDKPIFGTASADHTAKIWDMHSGEILLNYTGHSGSVNSISFHPSKELVVTGSGDGTAHIWQCAVPLYMEDEIDPSDKELMDEKESNQCISLKTPLKSFPSKRGRVITSAEWFPHRMEKIVAVGWESSIHLMNTEGKINLVSSLVSNRFESTQFTHVSVHPNDWVYVASGKNSKLFVCDERYMGPIITVYTGHTDRVTSAFLTKNDQIVSGSDDRTVKIWDLRHHDTPISTIQTDSPVNTLAVSPSGIIAVPQDNRNVRFYDLNRQSIGRLPRNPRQCHTRMVCSAAWVPNHLERPNLLTCGFDMFTWGWSVQFRDVKEGDLGNSSSQWHAEGSHSNSSSQAPGTSSSHKSNRE